MLWQTPNQLLLYDIVGPADLMSAVRLNATARYVGVLVGPAMGGLIMLTLGPAQTQRAPGSETSGRASSS